MEPFTLPNGDTIQLREASLIKERDRRRIARAYLDMSDDAYAEIKAAAEEDRAVAKSRLSAHDLDYMDRINDVSIVALIVKWDTAEGQSLPISVDSLEDMDAKSYAALAFEAAPLIEAIELDFSPTPARDGETPTVPVSA